MSLLSCCIGRETRKARRRGNRKGRSSGPQRDVIVEPTEEHTHTVILLHGTYYDGTEFEDVPGQVRKIAEDQGYAGAGGIKYVFPASPVNEDGDNFWYDYLADDDAPPMQCDNDEIDVGQWNAQVKRIADIVSSEVEALGDPRRVLIGGNSAGGTIAIHVALQAVAGPLGALLCLRTVPMRRTLGPAEPAPVEGEPDGSLRPGKASLEMPVLVYQAGLDDTYVPELQARNYGLLESAGFKVQFKVNPEGKHEDDDPGENMQAAEWAVAHCLAGS